MNAARPLEPGQHAVGATFGGAVLDAGFVTTPMPNLNVEGRSGVTSFMDRPVELNYGLNVTGIAFGLGSAHIGGAWLAMEQDGARPALALVDRVHLTSNVFDTTKDTKDVMAIMQLEALASWDTKPALLYVGAAQYLQFSNPMLTLTPVVGTELHLGQKWGLQVEFRHYAITQNKEPLDTVVWKTWGPGAYGVTVGFNRAIGGAE